MKQRKVICFLVKKCRLYFLGVEIKIEVRKKDFHLFRLIGDGSQFEMEISSR